MEYASIYRMPHGAAFVKQKSATQGSLGRSYAGSTKSINFSPNRKPPTTKMFEPLASFNRAGAQFHLELLSAERSFHQRRKRGPDYLCDLQSLPRGLEKPPPSNYYTSSLTAPRAVRRLTNWEPPNYDSCRDHRLSLQPIGLQGEAAMFSDRGFFFSFEMTRAPGTKAKRRQYWGDARGYNEYEADR
jgi:hypothetical protein